MFNRLNRARERLINDDVLFLNATCGSCRFGYVFGYAWVVESSYVVQILDICALHLRALDNRVAPPGPQPRTRSPKP